MNIKLSIQGELKTNSYLIDDGKLCYIIDPVENGIETKKEIENSNLEIAGVIITHFHLDHLKALGDFRDNKIYISSKDYKNLTSPNAMNYMRKTLYSPCFLSNSEENILNHTLEVAKIIQIDDDFLFPFAESLKVIKTPGHTSGSICIYSKSSKALFSGDTLFYHSYGRVDLPTGNANDMFLSLKRLSLLDKDTTVYPGHGNITSIQEEQEKGVLRSYGKGF